MGSESEPAKELTSGVQQQQTCHSHAGAEYVIRPSLAIFLYLTHDRHCEGAEASEGAASTRCDPVQRDYNVALWIGSLFVVLVASAIGEWILMTCSTHYLG